MEFQRSAIIQYSTKKTCFIGIPSSWATSSVTPETVFELEFGSDSRVAHFTWSGEITKQDNLLSCDVVEISGLYAKKLNIVEGDNVLIKKLSGIATCEKVWVKSISQQDLEILELNVNLIQTQLLNQTRIVWRNQELPVWINKSIVVYLRVVKLSVSSECGLLMELSEIHVLDDSFSNTRIETLSKLIKHENEVDSGVKNSKELQKLEPVSIPTKIDSETQSTNTILNWLMECISGLVEHLYITKDTVPSSHRTRKKLDDDNGVSKFTAPLEFNALFRVYPVPKINIEKIEQPETRTLLRQMTNVYIFANSLPKNINVEGLPSFFICRLVKVLLQETVQKKNNNVPNQKNSNKTNSDKPNLRIECCFVKVVLIDRIDSLSFCWPNLLNDYAVCFIPNSLRKHFGLEISCKVCLEATVCKPCDVRSISIHPVNHDILDPTKSEELYETTENKLKTMTSNCVPLVASNGTLLQLTLNDRTFDVLLSFNNSSSSLPVVFDVEQLKESIFLGVPAIELAKSTDSVTLPQFSHIKNMVLPFVFDNAQSLGGVFAEIQSGVEFLQLSLGLGHISSPLGCSFSDKSGALLVTGSRGSGKSSVAKAICARLACDPYWIYVKLIECKNLKGKKVENIFDTLQKALSEAKFRGPSVLLLDDLDVICKSPTQNEGDAGNLYLDHIAQAFSKLSTGMICSQVTLLVTATSKEFLHPFLANPKGRHFFHKFIPIPALDQEKRIEVLRCVIRDFPLDSVASFKAVNLSQIASQLEGAVARDLRLVLDRAVHSACTRLRIDCRNVVLDQSDFQCALDGFTPTALKGMSCHGKSGKSWQDIGGLDRVKKVLKEIFLWPSKYPKLFANCPLQLSSGVLLYGPPGTGKTLLASAVAKECSLNFISIKGPELLSKYIGASEQAVRDLFLRAQAARPSVIFFDEFDALAPRRGHDSTGVTDRVVNQLLTQLDGIEGRQGVYILAATSRPDLIDPALLRPGRLDKCLHCPLPTQEEIKEIVQILTSSMTNLDRTLLDFDRVVCYCEHLSGADVQSVLYSAQLMAIHSCCDAPSVLIPRTSDVKDEVWVHCLALEDGFMSDMPKWKKDEISRELDLTVRRTIGAQYGLVNCGNEENQLERQIVSVTEDMLIEAAKQTKPSVSASERKKYQIIYENFMKSRAGFADANNAVNNIQQKATLA